MHVHVVFAHPSHDSFTGRVLRAFQQGAADAGHTVTVSDLYAMDFDPVMSASEYLRESRRDLSIPVPDDVRFEQAQLDAADVWALIYPVWWTDCPAILKGWFDRVWTAGWAYNPQRLVRPRLALAMCTAGHDLATLVRQGHHQAMLATMVSDRINERAHHAQLYVFDATASPDGDEAARAKSRHLQTAARIGATLDGLS